MLRDGLAVDDQLAEQRANAWVNYLVVGVIIAYTAITVVNTLAMSTAARRREFALLRLSGTARGQVVGMMRRESVIVIAAGVGIGTLLSAFPLVLVSLAVSGTPIPAVPGLGYLAIAERDGGPRGRGHDAADADAAEDPAGRGDRREGMTSA